MNDPTFQVLISNPNPRHNKVKRTVNMDKCWLQSLLFIRYSLQFSSYLIINFLAVYGILVFMHVNSPFMFMDYFPNGNISLLFM